MGCGASDMNPGLTIVLIDRSTDTSIYLSGEHVEGIAEFDATLYDPNTQLEGAYVELVGQVTYTTTSTTRGANGNLVTHQNTVRVPFFNERHNFHSELTSENPMTISHFGKFSQTSFNFILPVELPPSLPPTGSSYNPQPYVSYFLRMILELKKWYQSNLRHYVPITVYPRINIQHELYQPLKIEYENRKNVRLHVNLPQSVILPNVPILIEYEIYNPNRSTVNTIIVQLCQKRHMGSRGFYKQTIFEIEIPNINEFNGEHLRSNFGLTIPADQLPPTSSYTFGNESGLLSCNPTSVSYKLIIEAKMSGFFTDFSMKCPITISTAIDNRSPPPSYASVMQLH